MTRSSLTPALTSRSASRSTSAAGRGTRSPRNFGMMRDDHLAVLVERSPDCFERFGLGAIEEPAGIDDDGIGAGMAAGKLVALGPQPRQDALAVDERLRAAEADERNPGRGRPRAGRNGGRHDRPLDA